MGGRLLRACRSRVGRSRAETQEGTDLTRRFARGATPRPCRVIAALEMHVAQTHDASVEEAATDRVDVLRGDRSLRGALRK